MSKFRKKPVVIEAVQWSSSEEAMQQVCDWAGDRYALKNTEAHELVIRTLEGDMTASRGDWIIKGVNGELYPCKPDIFAKTYDPVETTP